MTDFEQFCKDNNIALNYNHNQFLTAQMAWDAAMDSANEIVQKILETSNQTDYKDPYFYSIMTHRSLWNNRTSGILTKFPKGSTIGVNE